MLILLYLLAALLGLLAGGVVNALADDLPYRRNPGRPTYPDGTPRPLSAWLGLGAFLTGQRAPTPEQRAEIEAIPEEDRRARPYQQAQRLTWRYPLTELLTSALFMLTVHAAQQTPDMNALQLIIWWVYMAIFVLIIVIDVEYKLILFAVTLPTIALALADAVLLPDVGTDLRNALLGGALGFGVFFGLYLFGFVFTALMGRLRGQKIDTVAFGYGDVMMATITGLLVGAPHMFLTMFIIVFLGAFGAIAFLTLRTLAQGQGYQMFTAIPYGPYIVAATILMLLYGNQVRVALIGY